MEHYFALGKDEVECLISIFTGEEYATLSNLFALRNLVLKGLVEGYDNQLQFTHTGYDVARSFFILKNGIDGFLPAVCR